MIMLQTSPAAPGHYLGATTFRRRVRFFSLFSRRLVIKEVSLIKPRVVWPQDGEGKWKLPKWQEVQSSGVSRKPPVSVSQSRREGEFVQPTVPPMDIAP